MPPGNRLEPLTATERGSTASGSTINTGSASSRVTSSPDGRRDCRLPMKGVQFMRDISPHSPGRINPVEAVQQIPASVRKLAKLLDVPPDGSTRSSSASARITPDTSLRLGKHSVNRIVLAEPAEPRRHRSRARNPGRPECRYSHHSTPQPRYYISGDPSRHEQWVCPQHTSSPIRCHRCSIEQPGHRPVLPR